MKSIQAALIVCSVLILLVAMKAEARTDPFREYAIRNCPHYRVVAPGPIAFNADEKKLFCGDRKNVTWQDIPYEQATRFITIFLQNRGYFYPTFTEEGDVVIINTGDRAYIKDIVAVGELPDFADLSKLMLFIGRPLTPDNLDAIEDRARIALGIEGYPCHRVTSKADVDTGIVTLFVEMGPYQKILRIEEGPIEGLKPGTLKRYWAIKPGWRYNEQNVRLTQKRISMLDGIVSSTYFKKECTPEGVILKQESVPGKKRRLKIGAGFNTEEYFLARLTLKWVRIGGNGSSFKLSIGGSYRKQWLNLEAFIYPLKEPSPWHLNPLATTKRRFENKFRYYTFDAVLPVAVRWDTPDVGYRLGIGPKYTNVYTERGADKGDTDFLSANIRFNINSHSFYYYIDDPWSGYQLDFDVDLNSSKIFSSVTAQRLMMKYRAFFNVGGYDPPFLILAFRGHAATTLTDTSGSSFSKLPPPYFHYLGGSRDMRGFSRYSLPKNSRGALTALYSGIEGRFTNILPHGFEPLAFADVGILGTRSLNLDFPVYVSPGLGLRWRSIIATFRVTASRGFMINNNDPANNGAGGWQFYLTAGEEF